MNYIKYIFRTRLNVTSFIIIPNLTAHILIKLNCLISLAFIKSNAEQVRNINIKKKPSNLIDVYNLQSIFLTVTSTFLPENFFSYFSFKTSSNNSIYLIFGPYSPPPAFSSLVCICVRKCHSNLKTSPRNQKFRKILSRNCATKRQLNIRRWTFVDVGMPQRMRSFYSTIHFSLRCKTLYFFSAINFPYTFAFFRDLSLIKSISEWFW